MTCSSSIEPARQVSLPEGSMAMAYEVASWGAMKSVRAMGVCFLRTGTRALPA